MYFGSARLAPSFLHLSLATEINYKLNKSRLEWEKFQASKFSSNLALSTIDEVCHWL